MATPQRMIAVQWPRPSRNRRSTCQIAGSPQHIANRLTSTRGSTRRHPMPLDRLAQRGLVGDCSRVCGPAGHHRSVALADLQAAVPIVRQTTGGGAPVQFHFHRYRMRLRLPHGAETQGLRHREMCDAQTGSGQQQHQPGRENAAHAATARVSNCLARGSSMRPFRCTAWSFNSATCPHLVEQ
jgi:hypothetical protein